MLVQHTVSIKIVPANKQYWKNLGYDVVVGTDQEVKTTELSKNSNYTVLCKCDACGRNYYQRYSRDKEVCGSCRTSQRMKNNTLGTKDIQTKISKADLETEINQRKTKSYIAKKYNVSISFITKLLNHYDIKIPAYYGRKYFKNQQEENDAIAQIAQCNSNMNLTEISKHTNIPRHIIQLLKDNNKIDVKTQFDIWNNEYNKITENINRYVKLNEKLSLKQISHNEDISIEQLKKAFHENGAVVKLHSYNKSRGELECKEFIQNLNVNCHSIVLNKKYEIDCFAYENNFGVEYCGEFWHRYVPSKNNKNYHKHKHEFCKTKNVRLMTIFECEWKNKRDIIESMICSRLNKNEKIMARKCDIRMIPSSISNKFHESNHISGKVNSTINIGLYFDNTLYTVLSIVKSRFDKNYQYEISRYSTKKNFVVVGGLSKMFSYFVKTFDPESCMTYADLRFGEGKCYEKIGFSFIGTTAPNYFYFQKNGEELENRLKYQKHKLKNLIGYDSEKTEFEIMTDSNYYRLYDCGNNKYAWAKK